MITETDQVAKALEVAAQAWPEYSGDKSTLIKLLLAKGKESLESQNSAQTDSRLRAIQDASSQFVGVWPTTWQDEVRGEWPG
jgi:hypothetical protein